MRTPEVVSINKANPAALRFVECDVARYGYASILLANKVKVASALILINCLLNERGAIICGTVVDNNNFYIVIDLLENGCEGSVLYIAHY